MRRQIPLELEGLALGRPYEACDVGCALYDAFAASLATLLDAPLYSAHTRAHGAHPGVRLIGG